MIHLGKVTDTGIRKRSLYEIRPLKNTNIREFKRQQEPQLGYAGIKRTPGFKLNKRWGIRCKQFT